MQIVIDIPENKYKLIQEGEYCGLLDKDLYQNIKCGIPLSEKYGLLIDKDNLISRQAVLDAIEDDKRNGHYSCFASNNDAQCFKQIIKELPPVKPEYCEDAISRELALEKMADYVASGYADSAEDFEEYSKIICQLPPVNPAEKMGRWIAQDIHNCHTDFRCSKCGYIHDFMHLYGKPTADYTYCPNCGAKMGG